MKKLLKNLFSKKTSNSDTILGVSALLMMMLLIFASAVMDEMENRKHS
ncbi:MAG: hypothetical protein Q4B09_06825 [Lachnospiraceae bacterium]|nr:hypothetical protein [Lachnospiraceae bacterium]